MEVILLKRILRSTRFFKDSIQMNYSVYVCKGGSIVELYSSKNSFYTVD